MLVCLVGWFVWVVGLTCGVVCLVCFGWFLCFIALVFVEMLFGVICLLWMCVLFIDVRLGLFVRGLFVRIVVLGLIGL